MKWENMEHIRTNKFSMSLLILLLLLLAIVIFYDMYNAKNNWNIYDECTITSHKLNEDKTSSEVSTVVFNNVWVKYQLKNKGITIVRIVNEKGDFGSVLFSNDEVVCNNKIKTIH